MENHEAEVHKKDWQVLQHRKRTNSTLIQLQREVSDQEVADASEQPESDAKDDSPPTL